MNELADKESGVARVEDLAMDKLMMDMRTMSDRMDQLQKINSLLRRSR